MSSFTRKQLNRRDVMIGLGLVCGGAAFVPIAASCRRDGAEPPDRGQILADLSQLIIAPSYVDAATDAKALETAAAALRDTPTAETLTAARTAWKKARASWKATEAFLIGPADDLAVTGGIIDEIPDAAKVDANVTTGTQPLDDAAVQKLGANQRGLGGVEALLFDPTKDDATMLTAFQATDARRRTLAALVATDLRVKIDKVRDAWSTDYAGQLARAGRGSTVYTSEKQGMDAIVNSLIGAAEVIIALRLAKPLGIDKTPATPQPDLVESARSDASIDDILSVLDGIEAVYMTRSRDGQKSGLALGAAVAERSPAADTRMKSDLAKAREAVRAIPGPLRTAILERRDPVIAAHAACREVKRCLATDVAAALGTSVGFNVTDGD